MSDLIERQAAIEVIDAVFPVNPMKSEYAQGIACGAALAKTYVEQLPSAQPESDKEQLSRLIRAGIIATNTKDVYSCGMRNGMRWCRSLLDDKEPKFEDASQYAQPEIVRCKVCKRKGTKNCVANAWTTIFGVMVKDDFYCGLAERRTDEGD